MLNAIPAHVITGSLGAGKTSLLRQLLLQRPAGERWAVLVNEFGAMGLDAALLSPADPSVALAEVAGGCLCCATGPAFQVSLGRLLRQSRPDRLLIELSGLGHPEPLLRQLGQPPWQEVLQVQPLVMVLDAMALARGTLIPADQQALLPRAGLVVLNKSEGLSRQARQALVPALGGRPLVWTSQGQLDLACLPEQTARPGVAPDTLVVADTPVLPAVWRAADQPFCEVRADGLHWSIGWRWAPACCFRLDALEQWLGSWPWQRAKLIVRTAAGWVSANRLAGQPASGWSPSEWRRDSRLELIGPQTPEAPQLTARLRGCLAG